MKYPLDRDNEISPTQGVDHDNINIHNTITTIPANRPKKQLSQNNNFQQMYFVASLFFSQCFRSVSIIYLGYHTSIAWIMTTVGSLVDQFMCNNQSNQIKSININLRHLVKIHDFHIQGKNAKHTRCQHTHTSPPIFCSAHFITCPPPDSKRINSWAVIKHSLPNHPASWAYE